MGTVNYVSDSPSEPSENSSALSTPLTSLPSPSATVSTKNSQSDSSPSTFSGTTLVESFPPSHGVAPPSMPSAVPVACLPCRNRHLKCDGEQPCSRCSRYKENNIELDCTYVASRRGYKGSSRRGTVPEYPKKRRASASPSPTGDSCPMLLGAAPSATQRPPVSTTFNPVMVLPQSADLPSYPSRGYQPVKELPMYHLNQNSVMAYVPATPVQSLADRCFNSFYLNFHAAHPFVLPKPYLSHFNKGNSLRHLIAAMRWIGSLYIADAAPSRAAYFEEAHRLTYELGVAKNGFLVQAMLLLILGLDSSCELEKARNMLGEVEKLAVELAMNTKLFAALNGQGSPVLEESWRRTWWDLFIVDGMIAGVHRQTMFWLFDVPADTMLPVEEHEYLSGDIPPPMSLSDLEDSDFLGEDREFSSFAYRILAARNLGKFMRTPPILGPEDENLEKVEALLTNWRLHLPPAKKDALNKKGELDEMIFQGYMMTHASTILLHQPHSQLDASPAKDINSCAPYRDVASGDSFNAHTRHTVRAANEISKLITLPVPLTCHTHFFTCLITLSSIVHLSKWALFFVQHDDDDLRQQIRLNAGALVKLAQVWKSANKASGQVKVVAQDIYQVKKRQQTTPAWWEGLSRQQVMDAITADETIMREIETLPGLPGIVGLPPAMSR